MKNLIVLMVLSSFASFLLSSCSSSPKIEPVEVEFCIVKTKNFRISPLDSTTNRVDDKSKYRKEYTTVEFSLSLDSITELRPIEVHAFSASPTIDGTKDSEYIQTASKLYHLLMAIDETKVDFLIARFSDGVSCIKKITDQKGKILFENPYYRF